MLVKKINHKSLNLLGVDVWEAKNSHQSIGIAPEQIRIHVKCLVLLYQNEDAAQSVDDQKILDGMLGVLNLAPAQIMRATISLAANHEAILQKIGQWQPKYILQLNTEVPAFNSQTCVQTYSPQYLRLNPQYKPQAYKSLLNLRAMLHGTSQRNT